MDMAGIFVVFFGETLEKANGEIARLLTLKALPMKDFNLNFLKLHSATHCRDNSPRQSFR